MPTNDLFPEWIAVIRTPDGGWRVETNPFNLCRGGGIVPMAEYTKTLEIAVHTNGNGKAGA